MSNEIDIFKGVDNRPKFTEEDVTAVVVGGQTDYAPRISLKGGVFTLVKGKSKTKIGDGKSIKCVIIGSSGSKNRDSRRIYDSAYTGSDGIAPDCASINGVTPDSTVEKPKGTTCDLCPMSVWGSKIGRNGGKSRMCGAYRRLAVCTIREDGYDVFQIDIPVMSLQDLREYASKVTDVYHLPLDSILTDMSIDSPDGFVQLKFHEHLSLNQVQYEAIKELRNSDTVKAITTAELSVATIEDEKDDGDDTPVTPTTPKADKPKPIVVKQPVPQELKLDNTEVLKAKIDAALNGV